MRVSLRKAFNALSAAVLAAGVVTFAAPDTASAEGLFERLFSGFHHSRERSAPAPAAFADPFTSLARALSPPPPTRQRTESSGPSRGFCVRTCDGRYFPVQASGGASAAEMCHAFCPAAETKVYSGSNIDYATARNGERYADLDTAFLYRKRMVQGCSCNGRDAYGLAHINVAEDPTLKQGDVVMTKNGPVAYSGGKNRTAEFTPVRSYSGFSKSYREMLSALKLMPPNPGAPKDIVSSIPSTDSRSAQLDR
jgi:hypothetical protein